MFRGYFKLKFHYVLCNSQAICEKAGAKLPEPKNNQENRKLADFMQANSPDGKLKRQALDLKLCIVQTVT